MTDNLPPDVRELVERAYLTLHRAGAATLGSEIRQALLDAHAEIGRKDVLLDEASDNLEYAGQMLEEAARDAGAGFCKRQTAKFRAALKKGNNHG